MNLHRWFVLLLLACLGSIEACTEPLPAPSATAIAAATFGPTAHPSPLPSITPQAAQPSLPPALTPVTNATPDNTQAAAIQQARADLARRLQVSLALIEVHSVVADMFPVQNLGCPDVETTPQVGLPVEVTGLQITLSAEGKRYIYRARLQQIVYCGAE